jgi:hypothetical protein
MTTKLTDTQRHALNAGAAHHQGEIQFASSLKGGAKAKVVSALVGAKLAIYRKGTLVITNEGRVAIGAEPVEGGKPRRAKAEAKERAPRSDSKQARMIALMQRPQGMTLDEACKAFDWQRHTVRGAIAGGLKGKLGLNVQVEDAEGGRVYRIA